jgi:hypothetical protein
MEHKETDRVTRASLRRTSKRERRLLSVRSVAALLAVVVIVGALLAAEAFKTQAENLSSPTLRALALGVTEPLAAASGYLHLDRVGLWATATFRGGESPTVAGAGGPVAGGGTSGPRPTAATQPAGSTGAGGSATRPADVTGSSSTSSPPSSTGETSSASAAAPPASASSETGDQEASGARSTSISVPPTAPSSTTTSLHGSPSMATTSPATAATTPTTETTRPVTADQPLRVLVVGDSLVLQVGHGVTRAGDKLPLETKVVSKPMSGLTRTDYFDWPATLTKMLAEFKPDVTVMMFGNNDKQDIVVEGRRLERFTPPWLDMYRERVKAILDLARQGGGLAVLVGMPIMRNATFAQTALTFDQIYSDACAAAGGAAAGVFYIDSYALFADMGGAYSPYLPDSSGKTVLMRNQDGIHLTEAGGDLVADQIANVLEQRYDLAPR